MFAHKKTDTFSGIYKEKDKDDKSDFYVYKGVRRKFNF